MKASLSGVLIVDLTLKECCSHAEQKEVRTGGNSTMRLDYECNPSVNAEICF